MSWCHSFNPFSFSLGILDTQGKWTPSSVHFELKLMQPLQTVAIWLLISTQLLTKHTLNPEIELSVALNMGYHYLSMAIEMVFYLVILLNMSSPWHVHLAWGPTTCPWRWRKDWVWKRCSTARPPSARSEETKIFLYVHAPFLPIKYRETFSLL